MFGGVRRPDAPKFEKQSELITKQGCKARTDLNAVNRAMDGMIDISVIIFHVVNDKSRRDVPKIITCCW